MANPFDQFDAPQPQQMPQPQANPFDEFDAPQPQPTTREPSGFFDAFVGGYQGSATGLAFRGKLPDIVLNPEEADWYERLGAGAGSVVSELPIGVVGGAIGAIGGGAAGSAVPVVGNVAGAVVGGGAGSMALPAAIRESYIQAYTKGEIESSADFLNRVGLVLKQTAKEGLIGGLTAGAGRAATLTAQTAGAGAKTTLAAGMTAEASTLVVAPAALEGRLPEPQEFMDAAILLLGFKGATVGGAQLVKGAAKLAEIYRRTGKTPIEVMADAQRDPTIAEDLAASVDVYHGTKAQGVGIEQLSDSADLGPHFTVNRKTAEIFANDKGTSGTVLEGTARFSKSIELPDLATWFPTEVAQAIDNVRGVKPQADGQTPFQAKVWRAMEDARIAAVDSGASAADASAASNAAGYKVIRDALKADGYDSIKYTNKFEGEPADTYIALDISKVKAKATPTSETPSDAQRDPTIAEDLAAAKPADEFTGTITGVHGSERPLDSIKPAAEVLAESRYDGSGGVWGDGFYSADSGDYSWFRGSDLRMADYNAATTVESTFSRAAIFTPETTVALLKSLGVKGVDTPEQLAQILRDKGYDGAIVRQFAPADIDALMLKLQAEGVTSDTFIDQGGESAFMNQIVHFAPDKGVRIVGEEATIGPLVRERRKLKEELNAKAEARGFNHANDAYGTIYDVEKYAERRTETEKQNYDYVLKMAGDKYPRAKEFADETATEAARLKELDRKISGMAKPPKPETPPRRARDPARLSGAGTPGERAQCGSASVQAVGRVHREAVR